MTTDDRDILEQLIDRESVGVVLNAIAIIAREKAEHVSVNWQDRRLGQTWNALATKLETAARYGVNL